MKSEKICTTVIERHEENLFYKRERAEERGFVQERGFAYVCK